MATTCQSTARYPFQMRQRPGSLRSCAAQGALTGLGPSPRLGDHTGASACHGQRLPQAVSNVHHLPLPGTGRQQLRARCRLHGHACQSVLRTRASAFLPSPHPRGARAGADSRCCRLCPVTSRCTCRAGRQRPFQSTTGQVRAGRRGCWRGLQPARSEVWPLAAPQHPLPAYCLRLSLWPLVEGALAWPQ